MSIVHKWAYIIITTLELSKYVALCGNSTSIVRDRQREEEKWSKKRDRQTDRVRSRRTVCILTG